MALLRIVLFRPSKIRKMGCFRSVLLFERKDVSNDRISSEADQRLAPQGTGYRAIASVVGLSRDIVRNYCKSHGLDGYASVLTINMKEQMIKGQACLACGKEIVQPMTGRKRKFCSDECRRRWWSAHQDDLKKKPTAFYEKECAYCHKPFTAYGNKNRKYCSHECYVRDRFFWEEEGREPYTGRRQ
jgi:endogenous inhibitor of DNA gyrase (YacG/DUF329 family)